MKKIGVSRNDLLNKKSKECLEKQNIVLVNFKIADEVPAVPKIKKEVIMQDNGMNETERSERNQQNISILSMVNATSRRSWRRVL